MASPHESSQMQHAYSETLSIGSGGRERNTADSALFDSRGRGHTRPQAISITHPSAFASLTQQTPARSFVQRANHGFGGDFAIEANTETVREDTAELASRAFEDDSVYSASLSSRIWDDGSLRRMNLRDSNSPARRSISGPVRRDSRDEHRPQAILEESESPEDREDVLHQEHTTDRSAKRGRAPLVGTSGDTADASSADDPFAPVTVGAGIISQPNERTPLVKLGHGTAYNATNNGDTQDLESLKIRRSGLLGKLKADLSTAGAGMSHVAYVVAHPSGWDGRKVWTNVVVQPASYLPAVILGLLLNVLDALSYGMILFPLSIPVFSGLGSDGISMFYVSCIVSQIVYSCGGSVFKGGIGSEMIEVVPFFHSMAFAILNHVGEDKPREVLATTILSYSVSSIITGLAFFLLGSLKLGSLIGFFPRHILVGCIGGVGFFLVVTGLEVSARLDGNLEYNLETLHKLLQSDTVPLWSIPLGLAVVLLIIKRWIKHSLTDALYFVSIIAVFYIVVVAVPQLSVEDLRGKGWVFEAPEAGKPWWHFYTLYDFEAVDWEAFAQTIPAMLALTFFGLLHVPINVPALALTTGEDNLDLDRELRAHGYSNALSGFCGSIQNYLVYTNTVLFVRAGADSRVAGLLLAAATVAIMIVGSAIIGFIPIMVVGALIFFLGFDLLREAIFDTWGRTGKLEYLTIIVIVLTMGIHDFVVGIGVGIILACVSYVFQTSQVSAVRGGVPGGVASSTVRRHPIQKHYLNEVGGQIYVMRLSGYLFFGTIVGVENEIRKVLDEERFSDDPISFLVLDFGQVDGVDYSAAEAFTRIHRILSKKNVGMVMCGFSMNSSIGKNLCNVGLFEEEDEITFFTILNSALEHCENELLKTFYQRRDYMMQQSNELPQHSQHLDVPRTERQVSASLEAGAAGSPRSGQMHRAAASTLMSQQDPSAQRQWSRYKQPLQLIMQTFSFLAPSLDEEFWQRLVPYLVRESWSAGSVLYERGETADGFYLLQSGILKANYYLEQGTHGEVIVAGATCGELPFFSEEMRTSTTVAERDSVTWALRRDKWTELQDKDPEVARELLKISLKLTSERMDAITKYMLLMTET